MDAIADKQKVLSTSFSREFNQSASANRGEKFQTWSQKKLKRCRDAADVKSHAEQVFAEIYRLPYHPKPQCDVIRILVHLGARKRQYLLFNT